MTTTVCPAWRNSFQPPAPEPAINHAIEKLVEAGSRRPRILRQCVRLRDRPGAKAAFEGAGYTDEGLTRNLLVKGLGL